MRPINLQRIQNYSDRVERDINDDYANVMDITIAEVNAVQEEQEKEAAIDGIYESLSKDNHTFYNMVGFQQDEFEALADMIIPYIESHGRGRKRAHLPKDIIALILYYLRHYPKYEDIRSIFNIPEASFKGILSCYLPKIREAVETEFIFKVRSACEIPYKQDFPDCGFAVDATVQKITVPSKSFEFAKQYFSQKHGIYCLKSQVIVTLSGIAVHIVAGVNGSIHDKKVFDDSVDDFTNDVVKPRSGEIPEKILGDKGYQDQFSDTLVTPYKGNPMDLDKQQNIHNEKLGKIRVIVENFFGRLKMRYGIMRETYRGDHSLYPSLFVICCALVNFEIAFANHPLRDEGQYYVRQITRLIMEANDRAQTMAQKRKAYKEKRMRAKNRDEFDSDSF